MKDLIDQIKNKPILHSIDVDELSSFLDNSVSGPEVPVPIPVKLERPEKKEIVQVPFSYDADESELDTTEISNFPATVKRLLSKAEERSIKITSTPKPTKSSEMVHKLSIISINNKSDSSPGKSSNKRSSPSKSHHSPSQPPTIKSSDTKNRDNLPVKSVKVSKSVESPKTANLEIEKTNFKTKFRSESPEKRSKLSKSAESPKSKDREVKIQAESPDKRSKIAKSPDKASTSRPKESTKSLAIPEEELFSSPDLLVSSIPNKRIKLDEVVENTNKKLQVVRHLLPGNVKVIRNTRSSSGESLRNDVSIPEVSSDDEPLKVSMISRSRKRVRNLSASSGSSQDRSLYKRVVKNNHLNSQKISRTISSSTDDLSVNSAKSKAGQSLQNGGSSSDSGMIRKNYIDKVEVEENTEENVENNTAPVKSPKKIKKPTKRKTPVTRIR